MSEISIKMGSSHLTVPRVPVDKLTLEERAAFFTKRSLKKDSKMRALKMAVSMVDLTTLEGADTEGKVLSLCKKAKFPAPKFQIEKFCGEGFEIPQVAAVCVYPEMIEYAKRQLEGSSINIAAVATGFPSGQFPLNLKLKDVDYCIKQGANEIDMVINRGAFLSGDYQKVFNEIVEVKKVCQDRAHLKVILETGELKSLEKVRLASWLAMEAGADFIKTSTGKVQPGATLPVTLCMLYAISDFYRATGKKIGMKPAGGIRTAKQAIQYLVMVNEILGPEWLNPHMFRFGASTLLNDLLKQIFKQCSGQYFYSSAFALD